MRSWLLPLLLGLACGTVSAWGVGGGTLLLLVMTLLLGVDARTAQCVNLLFFLPTAASALYLHGKGGFLHAPTLKAAIPPAVLCAALGAFLSTAVSTDALRVPFGLYLLASAVLLLKRKDT